MTREYKNVCSACDWRGVTSDLLRAPNPFDLEDELLGCPRCKQVNTMKLACDEPSCWNEVTCGTPTSEGYRNTCSQHRPEELLK